MMGADSPGRNTEDSQAQAVGLRSRVLAALRSRRVLLFAAIVTVLLVGLLAGSAEEGPVPRWFGLFDDSRESAVSGDDPDTLDGSGPREMTGVDGGSSGGGVGAGSGSSSSGSGSAASGASTGGSGDGAGTGTGQAPAGDAVRPPDPSSQPSAPNQAVTYLDKAFGETMFPDEYPGLEVVNVFDYDDVEVTATYKNTGTARFDLIRITVERTESGSEAMRALEQVRELFPADTISYPWGGRDLVQSSDVSIEAAQDPAFNFSWAQGRYAIDVTVYPPYPSGAAGGRDAALDFIGRLGY